MLSPIYSTDIIFSYRSYNILEVFYYIIINQTASASCIYDEAEILTLYFNRNNGKFGLI